MSKLLIISAGVSEDLNNTPTYVLINNEGEKLGRRVGTFYPKYFENKIG